MCCDTCHRYDECEEKNMLKDECCKQCPEYEYCQGEYKFGDIDDETKMENGG